VDKQSRERLDKATDRALAAVSGLHKATQDNAPVTWDVVRFVIWKDKLTPIQCEEVARKALEYTGE
jgi:hypothetical protein